jgi:hypothetical protein
MMRFRKLLLIPIGAYIFILFALSGCGFSGHPVQTLSQVREEPMEVIIVPGMPYDSMDTPSLMLRRMHWAKILYDSGATTYIIFSGSSVYTPYKEGEVMKIMADSMGIPSSRTFAETKAEHSTENLYYSWKMAKDLGFTRIGVATDPFQMVMLKKTRRKYCQEVTFIPVGMRAAEFTGKVLPEINPESAYVDNFVSIKERENFWQRMRGTLGKRIKEEVEAEAQLSVMRIQESPTTSLPAESLKAN